MTTTKVYLYCISVLLLLSMVYCRKEESAPNNPEQGKLPVLYIDTLERQYSTLNEAIYFLFRDVYLWNDNTPKSFNYASYDDPEKLIDALRKQPEDRFTFIAEKQATDAFFEEGKQSDPGFVLTRDDSNSIAIALVEPNSAAEKAGFYRGMVVTQIAGKDIEAAIEDESIYDLLSQSTIVLRVRDSTRRLVTKSVTSAPYTTKTVLKSSVIQVGSKKVGYLAFSAFIATSEPELVNAFAFFKSNNIDELIVDLRYNGGGMLGIANQLASHIVGKQAAGKVFANVLFNNTYKSQNESIPFADTIPNTLGQLNRVFFLTTESTASASEAVINGLYPILGRSNVFIIGNKTYGKPYGSIGFGYRNALIFPIVLSITNNDKSGNYFNGLTPNAYRYDIVRHDWGDRRDNMLKEALTYIETGAFSGMQFRNEIQSKAHFMNPAKPNVLCYSLKTNKTLKVNH